MSGYLSTLVSRTLRPGDSVQPRLRSLFAPPTPGPDGPQMRAHDEEVAAVPESLDVCDVAEPELLTGALDSATSQKKSPAAAFREGARRASPKVPPVAISQNIERKAQPNPIEKDDLSREARTAQDMFSAPEGSAPEISSQEVVPFQRLEKRVIPRRDTHSLQPDPAPAKDEAAPIASSADQKSRSSRKTAVANASQLIMKQRDRSEVPVSDPREGQTSSPFVAPRARAVRNLQKNEPAGEASHLSEGVSPLVVSAFVQDVPFSRNTRKPESESALLPRSPISVRSRAIESQRRPPSQTPTIEVTIGRVEVRATLLRESSSTTRPAAPVVGLEEYLRRRSERTSG